MKPTIQGNLLSTLAGAPVSITGTATAVPGRWNVCSGTSSDYVVSLPPCASWAGKVLGLRMAPLASLSKRVAIDGDGSEKIDEATARIMWAGETAILFSDGANSFKIAGRSLAMTATAICSGVALSNAAFVKQPVDSSLVDNTAAMVDSVTNFRINILRDGYYLVGGKYEFSSITPYNGTYYCFVYKNGSLTLDGSGMGPTSASQSPVINVLPVPLSLASTDYLELYGRAFNASAQTPTNKAQLFAVEQPSW